MGMWTLTQTKKTVNVVWNMFLEIEKIEKIPNFYSA